MENNHLLETWQIHDRINLYILNAIALEAFATEPPVKGRDFAQMFAPHPQDASNVASVCKPKFITGLGEI